MEKQEKKFREQDRKGNYGVDGVSYDGEKIHVSGDETKKSEDSKPNPSKNPNGQKTDHKVPGSEDDPVELDRKKNLDAEGKASKI